MDTRCILAVSTHGASEIGHRLSEHCIGQPFPSFAPSALWPNAPGEMSIVAGSAGSSAAVFSMTSTIQAFIEGPGFGTGPGSGHFARSPTTQLASVDIGKRTTPDSTHTLNP